MLGERICLLRRRQGWSQAELAKRLRISPSTVGMYEQGRREPSSEVLVELGKLFGVSVDYILTGAPAPSEEQTLEKMLLSRISAADHRMGRRKDRPFSRQELATLFAAILLEP